MRLKRSKLDNHMFVLNSRRNINSSVIYFSIRPIHWGSGMKRLRPAAASKLEAAAGPDTGFRNVCV